MPTHRSFLLIPALTLVLSGSPSAFSSDNSTLSPQADVSHTLDTNLKERVKVFGIPLLAYDNIAPETLELARNSLNQIMDKNGDGQPDNPGLSSFMAQNGYRLVIMNKSEELTDIDESLFPEDKTAHISTQGLHADSHLSESLRIVAKAHLDHLSRLSEEGNTKAVKELESLTQAINKLKTLGYNTEFDNDTEGEPDLGMTIVASELLLAGQFQKLIDRTINLINAGLEKASEREGQTLNPELRFSLDRQMHVYKAWYESSSESFQAEATDMCEWLARNNLSVPSSLKIPENPIELDEETILGFAELGPFDVIESGYEDEEDTAPLS